MTQENPVPPSELQHKSAVVRTLGTMPSWKRKLMVVSLVVGLIGLGTQAASALLQHPTPPAQPVTPNGTPSAPAARSSNGQSKTPGGSSGFVSGQPVAAPVPGSADTTTAAPTTSPSEPTLTERATPWMTRIGLSFFVGIVAGIVFRTFAKVAVGFSVIIAGIFVALSYFHVLNIDMTAVKGEYASASAWLGDQVTRLKDAVFHALPSSSAAAAGFLSGFKKR